MAVHENSKTVVVGPLAAVWPSELDRKLIEFPRLGWRRAMGSGRDEFHARKQLELNVLPSFFPAAKVPQPRRKQIDPAGHHVLPASNPVRREHRFPAIVSDADHRNRCPLTRVTVANMKAAVELVVAVADDVSSDLNGISYDALHSKATAIHIGFDPFNRNATAKAAGQLNWLVWHRRSFRQEGAA